MPDPIAEPLPALSSLQLSAYENDGYLIVRGLLAGDEIEELRRQADRFLHRDDLVASTNLRVRWQPHVETGQLLLDVFDPVVDLAPSMERVAADPRILRVLESIYGEPACLFKDKLIYKPPGARGYDLHQDYIAWPEFPESFMTVVVALDPFDADSGRTEVFWGYHRDGYLSPRDGQYHSITDGTLDEARAVPLDLRPGDVAFFGCFTPHRSAPNHSGRTRRGLFLSYNARSDGGDQRDAHYRAFHDWLRTRHAERGELNMHFR